MERESIPPFLRYVRTFRNFKKTVYIGSGDRFNPVEAPYPPPGGVGDLVAVFQMVLALTGNHRIAEAAPFQGGQTVFITPHPINFIQILGTDAAVRFQPDITLGFQKIIHIVVIPLKSLPVFLGALALCEFEVVRYQPPQTLICPKEDALYLGLHLLRKIWIVFPVRWLRLGGENELTAVKAIAQGAKQENKNEDPEQ